MNNMSYQSRLKNLKSSCKLTSSQVSEIKTLLKLGTSKQYQIAEKYNVSQATISQIKKGHTWPDSKNTPANNWLSLK